MGEGLSASSDLPSSTASKSLVRPLPAVQSSQLYQQATKAYSVQKEQVKIFTKQETWELNASVSRGSLRDRFSQKEASKEQELLIRRQLNADLSNLADQCDLDSACASSCSPEQFNSAVAVALEASDNGLLWGKGSAFLNTQSDFQKTDLTPKTKQELTQQGYMLESSDEHAEWMEIKDALENNKEIQTVVSWAVRKEQYATSRAELSTLYFDEADKAESGELKQLDNKTFETIVNTLMELPEIKALLDQADKKDPKVWPLLSQYQNSPTHGEGVGYALILELVWPEKLTEMLLSENMQDAMAAYQQDNSNDYLNKNEIYQPEFSTSNLTRNYVREFIEQSDKPVSWWNLEAAVISDRRLTDDQKKSLVSNFYDGVYAETGWSPAEYQQKFLIREDYHQGSVSEIIARQKDSLAANSEIPLSLLDIPDLREQLPAAFFEKSSGLMDAAAEQLAFWDEALSKVFTEDNLEQTLENLTPESQQEVTEKLVQLDRSYAEHFTSIQERREKQGEEPLNIELDHLEVWATTISDTPLFDPSAVQLSVFEIGDKVQLPDGTPAEVMKDNILAIPADEIGAVAVMPQHSDPATVERVQNTVDALGLYTKPSETIALQQRFNRNVLFGGGVDMVNITDGVDTGIIESKGFQDFTNFIKFVSNQSWVGSHLNTEKINQVGREKHNAETAFTTADNKMREAFGFDSVVQSPAGKIDEWLAKYRAMQWASDSQVG